MCLNCSIEAGLTIDDDNVTLIPSIILRTGTSTFLPFNVYFKVIEFFNYTFT
jgi:hypothetical protein